MADSNWQVRIGTKVTDDIQKQLDTMPKKTVTVKAVLDTTGLKTIGTTELTKYEDALGNVVNTSKKFDSTGKELNNTIRSVKSTVDTTSKTLQTASKHTKTLGQDFLDTAGKVAKFGAITAIFGLVTTAISEAVKSVKELDSAMVEFKKVSSLSGSGLDNYTKKLGELGLEVARTKEEMVEASTEFVKAGYTEEESAKLAKTASLFQNIADTELSASEASTVLISNMKAFGMTSADSERVVDVINEVSNVFAVSSSDISAGLSKTASAMSTLGNTYEQSIALMVGAGEQMPNQSGKIARGLRSIGLEIVKTAKQTKELDTGYRDVTLSLYDQNGALKSTFDIMSELYPTWQKMTNEQKSNLGISLAGKQQYEVFSATMEGFDQVLKANEVALNSQGSAMKENEAYMSGIEAKTKLLKAQFDLLVNGDGGLNSFIKGLLDGATAFLQFANDTDLLKVALVDLGVILAITLIPNLVKVGATVVSMAATSIPRAITAWQLYMGTLTEVTVRGETLATSSIALGTAMKASIPIIGLVVAGISALALGINGYNSAQEKAKTQALESLKTFKSQNDALLQSIDSIQNEKTSKERLISVISSLNEAYDVEKGKLKDINSLREEAIGLLYDEAKEKARQTIRETGTAYKEAKEYMSKKVTLAGGFIYDIPEEAYKTAGELLDKYNKEIQSGVKIAPARVSVMSDLEKEYKAFGKELAENTSIIDDYDNSFAILNMSRKKYIQMSGEAQSAKSKFSDASEYATDSMADQRTELEELTEIILSLNSQLDSLQSLQSTAKSAIEEFNEHGAISLDTYQELLSYGGEYLTYLTNEEGGLLSINDAIKNVTIARINDLAYQKANEVIETAKKNSEEGKSFQNLAQDIDLANQTLWENIIAKTTLNGIDDKNAKQAQDIINNIDKWRKATISGVSANTDFAKSSSSVTDALKKQKEALKDNIDKYKSAFKYVEKLLDKDIDKVNELKDAEMARIDASIKALEEQRTNEEEYWDDKISALEAQNDAIEDQIELEQLQANLALARSKRVMVLGTNGKFGYGQDEGAIADAEQALSDYTRQQQMETELAILNNLKDQSLANINSQISAWETYKESQEANFDSQIATLEAYKQNFEDMTNSYEDEQSRLNALQLFGKDFEKQTWDTRLVNLANFVNEYNKLQAELGTSDTEQVPQTPTNTQYTEQVPQTPTNTQYTEQVPQTPTNDKTNRFIIFGSQLKTEQIPLLFLDRDRDSQIRTEQIQSPRLGVHASGVSSVASDEIAVVGDNPNNRELVIGSKLNGTATMLSQGSGVVNAQSTKTLAGILNTLGSSMGLNGQTIGATTTNQSNATSQSIQIANITLPSVTNGQGLLDELRGFASGMLQTAYSNV